MRVGIVTQPLENNIGGDMQNWALQQVLIQLGHQPETVDFHPDRVNFTLQRLMWIVKLNLLGALRSLRWQCKFRYYGLPTYRPVGHRRRFLQRNFRLSAPADVYQDREDIDAYIAGSDQIWRPMYNRSLSSMFLDFVPDSKPKITYAASFGVDNWEFSAEQEKVCSEAARRLNAVSVRESSGIQLCREHLGVTAVEVVDPTLLIDAEKYKMLCRDISSRTDFVHAYILDPAEETLRAIRSVKKRIGKKIREVHPLYTKDTEWLAGFRDCDSVLTDSFHGCVFSIIFHKPFAVIGNAERGMSRFESLLGRYGLSDRLCLTADEVVEVLNRPIDWARVDTELNRQRTKSLEFLKNALAKAELEEK